MSRVVDPDADLAHPSNAAKAVHECAQIRSGSRAIDVGAREPQRLPHLLERQPHAVAKSLTEEFTRKRA